MKLENNLDQLLETSAQVDSPSPEVVLAARNVVTAEAEEKATRAAKIVHLRRRHRRLTIGVAAAAVAGIIAVPLLSQHSNTAAPITADPGISQTPVVAQFRTVAQVVNAAATAYQAVDPTSASYWKTSSDYQVESCMGDQCSQLDGTRTAWTSTTGAKGVEQDSQFGGDLLPLGRGSITIDGHRYTWREFNARTWTNAQLNSVIHYQGTADASGYASRSWYSLKNVFDLLAEQPIAPAIRSQIWKIVEQIPGVELAGKANDRRGRAGWELRLVDPNQGTMSYIVDTATGRLLESTVTSNSGSVPTVYTYLGAQPSATAPSVTDPS